MTDIEGKRLRHVAQNIFGEFCFRLWDPVPVPSGGWVQPMDLPLAMYQMLLTLRRLN